MCEGGIERRDEIKREGVSREPRHQWLARCVVEVLRGGRYVREVWGGRYVREVYMDGEEGLREGREGRDEVKKENVSRGIERREGGRGVMVDRVGMSRRTRGS